MRSKKSLAFVLALVMILTLVPTSAFAATNNTVSKVLTVAADTDMPMATLNLKVDGASIPAGEVQKIKLTLENATWGVDPVNTANVVTNGAFTTSYAIAVDPATTVGGVTATSKTAEIEFTYVGAVTDGTVIPVNMYLHSDDIAGEVKVKVDGLDSMVSSGTYTVAVIGDGNTTAAVADDPTNTGRSSVTTAAIEFREIAVNSISGLQTIKLTLPKGVSWINATASGDMVVTSSAVVSATDDRDLFLSINPTANGSKREVLVVTPFISIGKDAKLGDIEVQVRQQLSGDNKISDASGLIIAKYAEEGITVTTVKEKDLPTIYAGRQWEDGTDEYTVEVTLEEVQKGSFIDNKYVDFTFPEWVQIASGAGVQYKVNSAAKTSVPGTDDNPDLDKDKSSFQWLVDDSVSGWTTSDTNKVVFTIPVTVDARKSGDIELTVSGPKAGVDETKLVVGKAATPLTATVKTSDIRTGVQNQVGGDIIIKETAPGAIREDVKLFVAIDDNNQDINFSDADVAVTAGDLEIGKAKVSNGIIEFNIDRASIKTAAEIKISGVELTLDRTPAEGKYDVLVYGPAIIDNQDYDDEDFSDDIAVADYINVVTPANQGVNAAFVIGTASYTANGKTTTMDAAPYIDAAGRTMVPVRYVANAMGVSDNSILWNAQTQTVTIFGEKVVALKMGSNTITANGTPITMDTVAVNNNGRIYVPARFVANALGASVSWDATTKTVSIFTVK